MIEKIRRLLGGEVLHRTDFPPRAHDPSFAGSVRCAGISRSWVSYDSVPARFGVLGFEILRRSEHGQIAIEGPHVHLIAVRGALVLQAVSTARRSQVAFSMRGDGIGYVDSLSGYPANDVGPETFPIEELLLQVELVPDATRFHIQIGCGKPLAWTFKAGMPDPNVRPTIDVTFSVTDEELPALFEEDARLAEALLNHRASYVYAKPA